MTTLTFQFEAIVKSKALLKCERIPEYLILENTLTIKIVNTVQCVSSSAKHLMNYNYLDTKI